MVAFGAPRERASPVPKVVSDVARASSCLALSLVAAYGLATHVHPATPLDALRWSACWGALGQAAFTAWTFLPQVRAETAVPTLGGALAGVGSVLLGTCLALLFAACLGVVGATATPFLVVGLASACLVVAAYSWRASPAGRRPR